MRPPLLLLLALALPALAAAQPLQVKASPAQVVLGHDDEVLLTVSSPRGPAGAVQAAASSGELTQLSAADEPVARFSYRPPDARHPHWATLLFWEVGAEAQPSPPTVLRLPLLGRTTLDIATEPNAQVVVQVQRARFGPVRANPQGQARVAVEVPPGVRSARVLATSGGEQTEREVELDVPADGALAVLLSPPSVRAGGVAWLAVAAEDSLTPEALHVELEGGSAQPLDSRPPVYRLTPAPGAKQVSVQVRRRDGGEPVTRLLEVQQAPPPPALPAASVPAQRRLALHLLGGAFFAGGANSGPALALGASHLLPILQERLALEVELGLRRARLEQPLTGGVDSARSRVLGAPLLVSLRMALLERGPLSLGARLGGGVTFFRHRLQSSGHSEFSEGGVDPAAFAALQGGYRLGALTLLVEARGSVQPVSTPQLHARLGGLGLSLGMRYVP